MRHLIHITRTASGNRELQAVGATTLSRYRALERQQPQELAEALERGDSIDHLHDEELLAAEVAHAGDPDVVIAIGFAVGACASFARGEEASIEALLELDPSGLDAEQRGKVEWLLEALRRAVGNDQVRMAPPAEFADLLQSAVGHQKN